MIDLTSDWKIRNNTNKGWNDLSETQMIHDLCPGVINQMRFSIHVLKISKFINLFSCDENSTPDNELCDFVFIPFTSQYKLKIKHAFTRRTFLIIWSKMKLCHNAPNLKIFHYIIALFSSMLIHSSG